MLCERTRVLLSERLCKRYILILAMVQGLSTSRSARCVTEGVRRETVTRCDTSARLVYTRQMTSVGEDVRAWASRINHGGTTQQRSNASIMAVFNAASKPSWLSTRTPPNVAVAHRDAPSSGPLLSMPLHSCSRGNEEAGSPDHGKRADLVRN